MREATRHEARRSWLTTADVAEQLGGCSSSHVRRLVRDGHLQAFNAGMPGGERRDWRFRQEWVDELQRNSGLSRHLPRPLPDGLPTVEELVGQAQPLPTAQVGVYFLMKDGEVVYVGQSAAVLARVCTHLRLGWIKCDSFTWIPVEREKLYEVEAAYIMALRPKYNRSGKR